MKIVFFITLFLFALNGSSQIDIYDGFTNNPYRWVDSMNIEYHTSSTKLYLRFKSNQGYAGATIRRHTENNNDSDTLLVDVFHLEFSAFSLASESDTLLELNSFLAFPKVVKVRLMLDTNTVIPGIYYREFFTHYGTFIQGINEQVNTDDYSLSKLEIYPNPVSNLLHIKSQKYIDHLLIFNTLGEVVYSINMSFKNGQIDCSNYPNGVYYVQFEIEGITQSREKFIVTR